MIALLCLELWILALKQLQNFLGHFVTQIHFKQMDPAVVEMIVGLAG